MNERSLHVITYHYVRDLPNSRYPAIKGLLLARFHEQIDALCREFEMATLETALAFLRGDYRPCRDLCLLTFDDGLKEHAAEVTPALAGRGIQGIFFLITSCLDGAVAPVHMNHFLTAELGFESYRRTFIATLQRISPELRPSFDVDASAARQTYPWDDPETAAFKYLLNFVLSPAVRDDLMRDLFRRYLGDEARFARELYVSWEEAREMQAAGMIIGGHSKSHRPLAAMREAELVWDLGRSKARLARNLAPQPLWPFSYPYGKRTSYTPCAMELLRRVGFACAFTTELGANRPGADLYSLARRDTNRVEELLQTVEAADVR